jgi:predicted nicotinamide N-methyase
MPEMVDAQHDHLAFIRENTRLLAPPLVPEIRLHLAEESLPLWEKTEEQLGQMNVPPPFWAFAWAGGQALARYIIDNRDLAAGRTVIDLGAGSGICAIAAALAGAAHVLAADVDPFSKYAIALNGAANGVAIDVATDNLLSAPPPAADLLLIGDLFYEKDLSEEVMDWAGRMLANGATVLVGDPRRSFFRIDRFDKVRDYSVPVTRALEDSEIKHTAVWQLRA